MKKDHTATEQLYESRKFIEELINENIALMKELTGLRLENSNLRRQLDSLRRFNRMFILRELKH